MTTPLKDSCRKHSLIEVKCAVEWGPRHVWGFHRQETGVESESPCPSSRGLWGLWCWGPHWSRRARRARIRKVANPCKSDRSCIALKEAFGRVFSSSRQFIPSPLMLSPIFIRGIPCLLESHQSSRLRHHRVHFEFLWPLPISFECKESSLQMLLVHVLRHTIRTTKRDGVPFVDQLGCGRSSFQEVGPVHGRSCCIARRMTSDRVFKPSWPTSMSKPCNVSSSSRIDVSVLCPLILVPPNHM